MSDLASLLEQVRSAKGADRELDWHVADATGHESFNTTIQGMWPPFMKGSRADKAVPAYTASIDVALALVERKLPPGWACGFDRGQKTAIAFVDPHDFEDRIGGGRYLAKAQTAPLAILAALLTALITRETPNGN
jgi:hypothetical protein